MEIYSTLQQIIGTDNVLINEPMSKHTTFRTGGSAEFVVMPHNIEQIIEIQKLCIKNKLPLYIVGNGSNLLVSDEGVRGIILLTRNLNYIQVQNNVVTAGAGLLLSALAGTAQKNALTGLEFAAGIPGTLGGACVMNAGAYGSEIKNVIIEVKAIDEAGDIITITRDNMNLSYRHSIFTDKKYIIVEATLALQSGNGDEIRNAMKELADRRRDKQPLEYPSAGSTFKRPEGYFAGKLIENSGLKGTGIGDACVSEKHAGFVINKGNATSKDIYDTINYVTEKVMEKQGVKLTPEVRLLGKF